MKSILLQVFTSKRFRQAIEQDIRTLKEIEQTIEFCNKYLDRSNRMYSAQYSNEANLLLQDLEDLEQE